MGRSDLRFPLGFWVEVFEGARLDASTVDEGLDVSLLEPDDTAKLVSGQLPLVDFAVAFLAQRELSGLASAVANDAATAALSDERFYRGAGGSGGGSEAGDIQIDPGAARRLAQEAVERRAPRGLRNIVVNTRVEGSRVCVQLRGDVDYVFAKGIPGAAGATTVEGRATATAVEGDAGTSTGEAPAC